MVKEVILLKVISVIGTTGCGKTHQCAELVEELTSVAENKPPSEGNLPMVLSLGKIFRGMFGDDFFTTQSNPSTSEATELLARALIHYSVQISSRYNKDLIIDGFPRSVSQLEYLMDTVKNLSRSGLEIRLICSNEEEQWKRLKNREEHLGCELDREFYLRKMITDATQIAALISVYKQRIGTDRFFTYTEVDNLG